MSYPKQIKARRKIEALTGIKSSLDKIRSVIALVYLLYVANERKSFVKYSISSGTKISIDPILLDSIEKLIGRKGLGAIINNNPLVINQYEPLYVGVTLLMKMGYLKMEGRLNTAERTGGVRFPKQLYFANNTLVLDLILKGIPEDVRYSSLYEWLQNKKSTSSDFEDRVCMFLSTCTVFTQFKLRDDFNNELFFQTEGIYTALREGNNDVVYSDSHELVGPTRIYNNVLREGLEPWVEINKSVLSFSKKINPDADSMGAMISTTLDINNVNYDTIVVDDNIEDFNTNDGAYKNDCTQVPSLYSPFVTAIQTKPFLLLAGISGTGKSRIVRELAFMTCPKELQDEDGTTPGNYCMIEVKPNWHDSSELLGYYSSFNGGGYRFTKFDRFVVKAWLNPDVPFFVCLDEMNLAPVEQYFAEFLSVLETRSRDKEGHVVTGALVDKQYFKDDTKMTTELGLDKGDDWTIKVRSDLVNKGLTLPPNLIVIGTVNMDDTTYQFSRKVIDRAMTIEMNGGELSQMFGNSNSLKYRSDEDVVKLGLFKAPYINADEVIERYQSQAQIIKEKLPEKLEAVNTALKDTPFQVSYRVLNELVIYLGALMDVSTAKGEAIDDDALPALIDQAMDQITLMKILPRIEGDEDMFRRSGGTNVLKTLQSLFSEETDSYKKLKEMIDRLDRTGFTRFWP